ncbi:TolC family protein [Gemmatimonadota bacterium]
MLSGPFTGTRRGMLLSASTLLAITVFGPSPVYAQSSASDTEVPAAHDTIMLELETAVRLALDQSWNMERMKLDLQRDQFNLQASRAGLKSNASLSLTLPNYDQSIKEIIDPNTGNPKLLSTQGSRYSLGVSIRQPLPTDGVISLNGELRRTQDRLFTYTPGLKTYNSKVYIRFEQPILQPNDLQLEIRRAELRLEETQMRFLNGQIDIINNVSDRFFRLYERTFEENLADEELQRMQRIYDIGHLRFQQGNMTEIDLLQLDVDLTDRQNRHASAAGRLQREKSGFRQLVGLGLDEEIDVVAEPTYRPVTIDRDLAFQRALQYRTEVRQNEIWIEYNEMDLRQRRAAGGIRGTVSLTLGLEGRGEAMDQLYDNILDPDQNRGAAVNFTVPLWDWGRTEARVNSKLAELEKVNRGLEEATLNIERQVRDVVDRVEEAQDRLVLLVQSVDAAERSYRLSVEQFEAGSLNTQDLILTQNRYADARRSYLGAYLDYRRALLDLEDQTYWDWERDRPLLETLRELLSEEDQRILESMGNGGQVTAPSANQPYPLPRL